ncbi:MAG: CHAD domain-containing protein [Pirellulaceae bacterium]
MMDPKSIKRQTPVHVAAAALFGDRLRQVCRWLSRIENGPPKKRVEAIHQLRVSTRRAMAALVLFDEFFPPGHARWYTKWLRQIRRAAGSARELDVMMHDLEASGEIDVETRGQLLKKLRKQRQRADRPILDICKQLKGGKLLKQRWRKTSSRMLRVPRPYFPFGEWARGKLQQEITRFFSAHPEDMEDVDQLHEFRIASKHFRYALELLEPAFPRQRYARVMPVMLRLQDRLGRINDHVTALHRLKKWPEDKPRGRKAIRLEKKRLRCAIAEFGLWWTDKRLARLEKWLEALPDRI